MENYYWCGLFRLRSVQITAFPNFRGPSPRRSGFGHAGGGTSSPPAAAKCVRTNSRILHRYFTSIFICSKARIKLIHTEERFVGEAFVLIGWQVLK